MVNLTGIEFGITPCISLTSILSNIALMKMVVSLLVVLTLVIRLFAPTSCLISQIEGQHPVLILMSYIGIALFTLDAKSMRFTALSKTEMEKMDSQNVLAIMAGREHMINDKQPHLN